MSTDQGCNLKSQAKDIDTFINGLRATQGRKNSTRLYKK